MFNNVWREAGTELPALMNDNYFTLLKGESKDIEIEFDSDLLPDGNYSLSVIPYNK